MHATFHAHALFFVLLTSPLCDKVPHLVGSPSTHSRQNRLWACSVVQLFAVWQLHGTATRQRAGRSGFESWQWREILLFSETSRLDLVPTQLPIQDTSGVKRPEREADRSHP